VEVVQLFYFFDLVGEYNIDDGKSRGSIEMDRLKSLAVEETVVK